MLVDRHFRSVAPCQPPLARRLRSEELQCSTADSETRTPAVVTLRLTREISANIDSNTRGDGCPGDQDKNLATLHTQCQCDYLQSAAGRSETNPEPLRDD